MKYFEKIESYLSQQMTPVEQIIFEQELTDNAALQQELLAYKDVQFLVDFAGEQLVETQIVDGEVDTLFKEVDTVRRSSSIKIGGLVLASFLALIGVFYYTNSTPKANTATINVVDNPPASIMPTRTAIGKNARNALKEETPINDAKLKAKKANNNPAIFTNPGSKLKTQRSTPEKHDSYKNIPIANLGPKVTVPTSKQTSTNAISKMGIQSVSPLNNKQIAIANNIDVAVNAVVFTEKAIVYQAKESIILKEGIYEPTNTSLEMVIIPD